MIRNGALSKILTVVVDRTAASDSSIRIEINLNLRRLPAVLIMQQREPIEEGRRSRSVKGTEPAGLTPRIRSM